MRDALKLIISGDSRRLDDAINRSGRNIRNFGNRTAAVFSRMGRTIGNFGDRIITPITSIASGAAIAMAGKNVIDFDARLARLKNQAGMTKKEMYELKAELLEMSHKTYQVPTDLLSGMEQIVEKTGNLKLAKETLYDMGIAASGANAEMEAIGAVTSNLNEKLRIGKNEMRAAFDILYAQGNKGAFTLRDLSRLGERLFASAAGFGVRGVTGLRQFGAFVQIARRGTGSSEMATTAVERTLADLVAKAKKVKAVTGFSIFDAEASKKEGRAVMKSIDVVLKEIIRRTNGDEVKLQRIFGEESIRAIRALALSYREYGDFREFDAFVKTGGDGVEIMKAFDFWTEQTSAKINRFRGEMSKLANENLAGPIELFTKALEILNRHPLMTKGGIGAILSIAGAVVGVKAYRGISGMFKGGKGGVPGASGLPGFGKTPIPVYVVNKHLSMLPETFGAGRQKVPGTGGMAAGKAIPGLFARGAGRLISAGKWLLTGTGALTTAAAAAAATAVSTAAYAAYDVARGGTGKNWISESAVWKGWYGDKLYDLLHKSEGAEKKTEVKNDIAISLAIDEFGRLSATTADMGTNISLKRGKF